MFRGSPLNPFTNEPLQPHNVILRRSGQPPATKLPDKRQPVGRRLAERDVDCCYFIVSDTMPYRASQWLGRLKSKKGLFIFICKALYIGELVRAHPGELNERSKPGDILVTRELAGQHADHL